jgi:hypothetical protein
MDYNKLNDFLEDKNRFVVKHDVSIHHSVAHSNQFTGTSTTSKSPTTTVKSDEVIHVELDPELKEYIRNKLNNRKNKYMNYEQSLGCNVGISPTLFSSLTGGLSKEDIR